MNNRVKYRNFASSLYSNVAVIKYNQLNSNTLCTNRMCLCFERIEIIRKFNSESAGFFAEVSK